MLESKRRNELLKDNNVPKSVWSKIKRAGSRTDKPDASISGQDWNDYFSD